MEHRRDGDVQSRLRGEGEQTGVLTGPRLGGLSTTPSSTLSFVKSIVADAASVAVNISKRLEAREAATLAESETEHSGKDVM